MRVAIITMNSRANYGGILQAYALATVIQLLGHDPKVIYIKTRKNYTLFRTPYHILKNIWRKIFKKERVIVFYEKKFNKEFPIVSFQTQQFINRNIPHIELKNFSNLKCEDWDALVVGSDQIWRPSYQWHLIPDYYLRFAKKWNVKRVAYAPSFGIEEWEYSKKQELLCRKLIKQFDAVSVREISAVGLCRKHFNIEATSVLDPTLLLTRNIYEQLVFENNTPSSPGNLLCYILNENEDKESFINRISARLYLKPFRVNSRYEDPFAPLVERIQPPVERWIRGFMDAKFVVTDSFHACVFSVIFKKPFLVIGNKSRGMTRFTSLLSQIGLEDRLITDVSTIPQNITDIDWNVVEKRLDVLKKKSIDYLNTALSSSI